MSNAMQNHPYDPLTPDTVLDAVESAGLLTDARILALNSYENRVYQVGLEDDAPVIAKFYRPGRWTRQQIQEEHDFTLELAENELPVVAPMTLHTGKTLHEYNGFLFSLTPRRGGHAPELDNPDHLFQLGRLMGRIHKIGETKPFAHRPGITLQRFVKDSIAYLLDNQFIPESLLPAYTTLTNDLVEKLEHIQHAYHYNLIRLHGDAHCGNILWRDEYFHFVDFDDCVNGPAIQDLWMFLSGDRSNQTAQLSELMDGYAEFNDFNPVELNLIEYFRTLRIINYSAWLARRWDDPAFPMAFPWFNSERYWADHILELREQLAALDEPVLTLY